MHTRHFLTCTMHAIMYIHRHNTLRLYGGTAEPSIPNIDPVPLEQSPVSGGIYMYTYRNIYTYALAHICAAHICTAAYHPIHVLLSKTFEPNTHRG